MGSPGVEHRGGASVALRAAAFGVDMGMVAAWAGVAAGAGWLLRRRGRSLTPAQADMLALGSLVAPTVLTFAAMEASGWQATPGKALVGLRVQSVDGHRLTLARAVARTTVKLAPWQLAHTAVFRMAAGSPQRRWPALATAAQLAVVGSAVTSWRDPDHRCWHDMLTRTRVVGQRSS